ncbi:MAG: ABC transporter substrate-binding protein, partial [Candidatus Thorarchaeota archaeon]|nr:ABC transporter substrate-binding protein [Candidatus Thorarchaeota archaeon]
YKHGPDLNPWPDLAEHMWTETHSDNPAVPDGHTRFTIDIIQNATWSDGVPLTAQDVAFSITYAFESAIYGNPATNDIGDLIAAYATTNFRVIIEFSSETYWHFSNFAYDYIIPEHIFNDATGIGYDGWNTWNPVFDPAETNVNCGPFIFTDYDDGEYYKIERNPLFHYAADIDNPIEPTSNTISRSGTTTGQTNLTTPQELNWSTVAIYTIGTSSGAIIIFCIVIIMRERQNLENI